MDDHTIARIPYVRTKTAKIYQASSSKRWYQSLYAACYADARVQVVNEILGKIERNHPDSEWWSDPDVKKAYYHEVLATEFPPCNEKGCCKPYRESTDVEAVYSHPAPCAWCHRSYKQYIKDRARFIMKRVRETKMINE